MMFTFPLRRVAGIHKPQYETINLSLPDDFAQADVERLYRWLRTLPHDDPKPLTTVHDELTMAWGRNAGLANALEHIASVCGIATPDGVREDSWALAAQIGLYIQNKRERDPVLVGLLRELLVAGKPEPIDHPGSCRRAGDYTSACSCGRDDEDLARLHRWQELTARADQLLAEVA